CVQAGVVVVGYEDDASGVMVEDGKGGGSFAEVVLRPRVVVADAGMTDAATAAHHQAHEWCFIARSVNFPVTVEPVVSVASAPAR
ncbi:MAG: OsmC family peroxiredoxin, partial [Microbacterium sp.]|nr:OsmC family peroxiredoxin [Microbacterium sp.]